MSSTPPGWYHALGDPEGTVRYWDGNSWTATPVSPPPGWVDPYASGATHSAPHANFAGVGIRIWAAIIDDIIAMILLLPFMIPYLQDVFADVYAGGDGTSVPVPSELFLLGPALLVLWVLMIAYVGATPGKLLLKLRITTEDGVSTPPGLKKALLRAIPDAVGFIPGIGSAVAFGVAIAAIVTVSSDEQERRSIYDHVAKTRVIRIR